MTEIVPSAQQRTHPRKAARRIRDFITKAAAEGASRAGEKLPTERELAARFEVPRHTVRKTLAALEAEGSITRHVGRGTFLAGSMRKDLSALPADSVAHTSPAELMDARLRIEPALAELIVTHGTQADLERMEACLEKAERASTLDQFELWDAALHQAFASATHNRFIARVLDMVAAVRQQSEWGKLKDRIVTPERRIKYQEEHRAIVEALKARDAERARQAILTHLEHARRNLFNSGGR